MDEHMTRLRVPTKARALGGGGPPASATAIRGTRILHDIEERTPAIAGKTLRRPGGVRPSIIETHPHLVEDLESLVDPVTRGEPESPLRWTCNSLNKPLVAMKLMEFDLEITERGAS
jgi:hypothetical protein